MKRIFSAALLTLALLLSLSGCIVIPIYKNFDLDPETAGGQNQILNNLSAEGFIAGFHIRQMDVGKNI